MKALYEIADLTIEMESNYERTSRQAAPYLTLKNKTPDFSVSVAPETLELYQEKYPALNSNDWEYMLTGSDFYHKILFHDGLMLHASCVVCEGKAYLFSAPSGTGKSTHTQLWIKYFKEKEPFILNDDKPAIRLVDGKYYAYGTPWSGKYDISKNIGVPLQGIAFLERGMKNSISRMIPKDVIFKFMNQTVRPKDPESVELLLHFLDQMLTKVPVYQLTCDMSEEAALLSYKTMSK